MKKLLLFSLILYSVFAFTRSEKLDTQEVKALKEIWGKLGLTESDFDKDPCSVEGNWRDSVICDCPKESNSTSSCHVIQVTLQNLNVSTYLPVEFTKLQHLDTLSLEHNLLRGTIPSEWATMRLTTLSLIGNRLSGPFPSALTRMTTLLTLSIDVNRFSGPIPREIANLKSLLRLSLSSNGFTGELPFTLAELTNLTTLNIQGCSFTGPIPSGISVLNKLTELRISDLIGGASAFPPLENMIYLSHLVIRNCFVYGPIPFYVGKMQYLHTLDLSFNNLTGEIPSSFSELKYVEYIYLARNNLTGPMPQWVMSSNQNVDVSYNNFTWDASGPYNCDQRTINMVESYSSLSTNIQEDIHPCLMRDFPCMKPYTDQIYSLHINCGGEAVYINSTTLEYEANTTSTSIVKYEADREKRGASIYSNGGNWAFSSTGNFKDTYDDYILSNTSNLHNISTCDTKLYTTARKTAISITYYGLCLINGNYNVTLHFAEILFTQDNSINSLGKRVFNVYVQGELKLKDFDIVKEAGGTGTAVIKRYMVNVKKNTLKIQLYWAGKGTTSIPVPGSYGPIISAISVEPNFVEPPGPPIMNLKKKKSKVGLVVGTIFGGIILAFVIIVILWRKGYIMGDRIADRELRGVDFEQHTRMQMFTEKQIKDATNNFDPSNKLGEGGFGIVYKGILADGTMVAIKQLSSDSKQGIPEFVTEIGTISSLQHDNIVRLYGCCVESNQFCLVYEYMENNCLSKALLGKNRTLKAKLTWAVRTKICIGIARGLICLHEESKPAILHRDIKASNVLLDESLNAKISDFGLAKLYDNENSQIMTTRMAGTIGYMAPEATRCHLTLKTDVYSFGILVLEIVSGKSSSEHRPAEFFGLLDWAYSLQESGSLLELVDPDLGSEYSSKEVLRLLNVALLCTQPSPASRPTMAKIIDILEGHANIKDLLKDLRSSTESPPVIMGFRKHFWQEDISTEQARPVSDEELITDYVFLT